MINPIHSVSSALSGLQALAGVAQGTTRSLTGQNLPAGAAGSAAKAASAQTASPSSQFASSTLSALLASQTSQTNAASLHAHHHHHHKSGTSEEAANQQASSVSSNQSIAAPTPTSDSPSTGVTNLLQTFAQIALSV